MLRVRRSAVLCVLIAVAARRRRVPLHLGPAPPRAPGGVVAGALVRRHPAHHAARRRGPRPGDARRDGAEPAQGRRRDRGPAVLRARRRRRPRHRPGTDPRRRERQPRRGRLDDHPAVRPRGDARTGEGPRAQAARGRDGDAARAPVLEADDPRALPQHRSTSATAPTACRPRPGATSARTSSDLDLAQSALLAGLIRSPETTTRIVHPDAALDPAQRGARQDRASSTAPAPRSVAAARAQPRRAWRRSRPTTTTPRRTSSSR